MPIRKNRSSVINGKIEESGEASEQDLFIHNLVLFLGRKLD